MKISFLIYFFLITACLVIVHSDHVVMAGEMPSREVIHYDIKKLGLTVGQATLAFEGEVSLDGQSVILIIFTAKALKVYDEERIYLHLETGYPLMVHRDIDVWGKQEMIEERYESDQGRVVITKTVKGKSSQHIIEKSGRLDNIYAFIYRYRQNGIFQKGEAIHLNLPTADVDIRLLDQRQIMIDSVKRSAYFLQSHPKKYALWFGIGADKLPLRIDGAVVGGKTAMVMTSVQDTGVKLLKKE